MKLSRLSRESPSLLAHKNLLVTWSPVCVHGAKGRSSVHDCTRASIARTLTRRNMPQQPSCITSVSPARERLVLLVLKRPLPGAMAAGIASRYKTGPRLETYR